MIMSTCASIQIQTRANMQGQMQIDCWTVGTCTKKHDYAIGVPVLVSCTLQIQNTILSRNKYEQS